MKFSDYILFREADETSATDVATDEPIIVNPEQDEEKIQPKISKKICEPINQIFSNVKEILKSGRAKNLSDKQIFNAAKEELFKSYDLVNRYLNSYIKKYFKNLDEKGIDVDDVISDIIVLLLSPNPKDASKFKIDYEKYDYSNTQMACKILNTVARVEVLAKIRMSKKERPTSKGSELEQLPEKGRRIGDVEVGKDIAGDIEKSVDTEKDDNEDNLSNISTDSEELVKKIQDIIDNDLAGQRKNVAIAHWTNQLSLKEIENTLGISTQAIGQLWKKAKKQILQKLGFSDEKIEKMLTRKTAFIQDNPVTAAVLNALRSPDEFPTRLMRQTKLSRPADMGYESEPALGFTGSSQLGLSNIPILDRPEYAPKAISRKTLPFEGPEGRPEPSRFSLDKFIERPIRLGKIRFHEPVSVTRERMIKRWVEYMQKKSKNLLKFRRISIKGYLSHKKKVSEKAYRSNDPRKIYKFKKNTIPHVRSMIQYLKDRYDEAMSDLVNEYLKEKKEYIDVYYPPDVEDKKHEPKPEEFSSEADYIDALGKFYGVRRRQGEEITPVTVGKHNLLWADVEPVANPYADVEPYIGGSYYKPAHVGIDKIENIAKDLVAKSREEKANNPELNVASHALAAASRVEKASGGYYRGLRDAVSKLVSFAVPEPKFNPNQASSNDMFEAGAMKFVNDNLPEIMAQLEIEHPDESPTFYQDAAASELLRHAIEFERQHPNLRGVPVSTIGTRFRGKGSSFGFANAVSKYFNEKIRPAASEIMNVPPRWQEPWMGAMPTTVSTERGRVYDVQLIAMRLLADNQDVEIAKSTAEKMEAATIIGYKKVKKKNAAGEVEEIELPVSRLENLSKKVSELGKLFEELPPNELRFFNRLPNVVEKLRFLKASKLDRSRIMKPKFPN
jgi:RNA polymerase sigma factor (sigma-70 family)